MSKTALITGITGQDGSYLAEFLLEKGYQVYGLFRRGSSNTAERIAHLLEERERQGDGLHLVYGDMTDSMNLVRLMLEIRPDEVYNLAAQSHVAVSFEEPEYTANADGIGGLKDSGGSPRGRPWEDHEDLPGLHLGAFRKGGGDSPEGDDALPSPLPLRGGEALRLLDHPPLPGSLRDVRGKRHPVQPRIRAPRRDLRDPQNHAGGGEHRRRAAGKAVSGEPERETGLGLRQGLHTRSRV